MTWRERLQPASFRGVPFDVEGSSDRVGRRGQTHEYPASDVPYHEDLGRLARRHSLDAFLVGDDYLERRDRLLTALEAAGPGALVHPWFGELQANVDGECSVSHRWDDGGYCVISIAFVQAGELRYPTGVRDTAGLLLGQADLLQASAAAGLLGGWEISGWPDFVSLESLARVTTVLNRVSGQLGRLGRVLDDPFSLIRDQVSSWLGPGGDVGRFASAVTGLWRQARDMAVTPQRGLAQARGLLSLATDSGLRPVVSWPTQTAQAARVVANQNAVTAYLRQSVLIEAMVLVSTLPVPRVEPVRDRPSVAAAGGLDAERMPAEQAGHAELLELRQHLAAAFDREAMRSPDDTLFERLEQARLAVHADLSDRASQAPRLESRQAPAVLPAVVLAARWFDDAGRADEIVVRNGIRHPGFVPVMPLKVLST